MSYVCESCGGENPCTLLLVNLQSGVTDSACDADAALLLIGNLAVNLGVDPQKLYDVIQKFTAREAAKEAKAAEAAEAAQPRVDDPAAGPFDGARLLGPAEVLAAAAADSDGGNDQ